MAQFQILLAIGDADGFQPIAFTTTPISADAWHWRRYTTGNTQAVGIWPSFDEALAALDLLRNSGYPASYRWRIGVEGDDLSDLDWQTREKVRFSNGTYTQTPWHAEPWYQAKHEQLFAHMSRKTPGSISFTENEAKGAADRQAQGMRPGRFLHRFFGDVLSNEEIEGWCAKLSVLLAEDQLKITQDADEIEAVYIGGPRSCMAYRLPSYQSQEHPTRAYAGPDCAVAYIGSRDDAKARCVVWPERKIYTRVYGDVSRLTLLLEEAGYREGDLDGARIQRIEQGDYFVVPYIDAGGNLSDDGDYLIIGAGGITCGSTDGLARRPWYCPNCDVLEQQYARVYSADADGEYWCESCCDSDTTICYHDDRRYPNERGFTTVNRDYGPVEIMDDNLDAFGAVYLQDRGEHWDSDDCGQCAATEQWFHLEDLTDYNGELLSDGHAPDPIDDEDEAQVNGHVMAYQQFKAEMAELHALADRWARAGEQQRRLRLAQEECDRRLAQERAENDRQIAEYRRSVMGQPEPSSQLYERARRYGYVDSSCGCDVCRAAMDRAQRELHAEASSPYSYLDMARSTRQAPPPRCIVDELNFAFRRPASNVFLNPGV